MVHRDSFCPSNCSSTLTPRNLTLRLNVIMMRETRTIYRKTCGAHESDLQNSGRFLRSNEKETARFNILINSVSLRCVHTGENRVRKRNFALYRKQVLLKTSFLHSFYSVWAHLYSQINIIKNVCIICLQINGILTFITRQTTFVPSFVRTPIHFY